MSDRSETMATDKPDEVAEVVEEGGADGPLTARQEAFARAYADPDSETFGSATAAAEAAGYSQARSSGWKLRRHPGVAKRIGALQDEAAAGRGKVLADLENTRLRALAKGDLSVAVRCSELQGRRLGIFFESHAISMAAPAEQREYDERLASEAHRIARVLLEQDATAKLHGAAEAARQGFEDRPALPPAPGHDKETGR